MVSFSRVRWSTVALPFCPPAWASVILMVFDILLLIILSNIFPKLLAKVIPLSFEHFPFVPLPLYSRIISPVCHWVDILCVCIILFIVCRYMCISVSTKPPWLQLCKCRVDVYIFAFDCLLYQQSISTPLEYYIKVITTYTYCVMQVTINSHYCTKVCSKSVLGENSSPAQHFGAWCPHTRGSEFVSLEINSEPLV